MADPIDIAVGGRVRARRGELGLAQADLAQHLGLSFQQVQKYERGANRISASMLVKTAERLHCTVAYLVGESVTPLPSDDLLAELRDPKALDLLRLFSEIAPKRRDTMLEIVRTLARDQS